LQENAGIPINYARLIVNTKKERWIMSGELTKKDWAHIISLLQFDYFKGNKQSEKLFYKVVELRQQVGRS
jgi:hypothetical protein